ncbi:hypothetical protein SISSUDRAFT_571681 [Sistotremastrum suecicum HHB10207 ss-3]|uniref:ARM repeat-containing protein n=1 Tax=Sistotremastrum suecicum HHB10207 ss-3 TaxID=1314776 RepID=A0A166ERE2_9AGAM|nr:hypothetical protein SISSUDRAFT_571681 [Sistotremastrum suecicum HHB10207 ss-3]
MHWVFDTIQGIPRALVEDVYARNKAGATVHLVQEYLQLDMESRSGMKRIHENYPEIMADMSRLYMENEENDYIVNEVIGLIGNMCLDAVLRNKIYRDGWLPRILALDRPRIGHHSPLPALQTFLMHPSPEIFEDLCTNVIPRLSRLLLDSSLRFEVR